MKVVVAIDSFKGSLSSYEAGEAAKKGIRNVFKNASVIVTAIADGGEGTLKALADSLPIDMQKVNVHNAVGEIIEAEYGIIIDKNTAIIEVAAAIGLPMIDLSQRNPLNTSSFGVGELIIDALDKGVRRFIIGLGGSATNDGGVGMLQALGFGFWDCDGKSLDHSGRALEKLSAITIQNADSRLKSCEFLVACDVNNPLCGEQGCSAVFAPQKGADSDTVFKMDQWLQQYADLTLNVIPDADDSFSGVGAAGGLGYAFYNYLGAVLRSGIELVLDEVEIEKHISDADIVVTGEGRLDAQTMMGKAPAGVAKMAQKYQKPVVAFSGCFGNGVSSCNEYGIDAFFSILNEVLTESEALDHNTAFENLVLTVEQAFRLVDKVMSLGDKNG